MPGLESGRPSTEQELAQDNRTVPSPDMAQRRPCHTYPTPHLPEEARMQGMRLAPGLGCSGAPRKSTHPQILTGLTVDACIAMWALAEVLGEDVPPVRVLDHLALTIIVAGVWDTRT